MEINFIKDLIKCLSGLEFQIINFSEEKLLKYFNENFNIMGNVFKNSKDLMRLLRFQPNCIYEFNTFFGASQILFYLEKSDLVYSLGPALNEPFSEYQAIRKIRKMGLSAEMENDLIAYGKSLPVVSTGTLNHLAHMLYRKFSENSSHVEYKTVKIFEDSIPQLSTPQNERGSKTMRKVEKRYELSRALNQAVKQGNFSLAMQLISKNDLSSDFEVRNHSPLRNLQNYCIILNTQLRHALEETSIHPYELDKISSNIGMKIEKLDSIKKAESLIIQIIKQYCQFVKENTFPNLKPLMHLAVTYIKDHLSENITVKDTAKALTVNANYLSTVFQKEMGISFTKFVNRERLRQAADLLKYSNIPIQEISYTVGYNNTSYFAKQFKKEYGKSPRDYRA